MATLPQLGEPNKKLADALKQLSKAKYGHPRADVEKIIFDRMKTEEVLPVSAPNIGGINPSGIPDKPMTARSSSPPPKLGGSFLDDWLAKRQNIVAKTQPSVPAQAVNNSMSINTPAPQQDSAKPNENVYVDDEGGVNYKINQG